VPAAAAEAAEGESDDGGDVSADEAPKRAVPPRQAPPAPAEEVPVRPGGKSIKELADELKRDAGASDGDGGDDDA
jgi:hypothetical protein